MINFIVGTLLGGFFGAMWMALCNIVDDVDELAQEELKEVDTDDRCQFCGGKLSSVLIDDYGNEYKHCYSCHFDFEVDE